MNNMELRSSRSRSKTPFKGFIDREVIESGNHVEQTLVRSTRSTTVIKTNESATSSTDEINTSRDISFQPKPARKSASRSERSLRSRVLKTSDYSSEDGENEVSSTKTINQNERNQLLEDARNLANGSEMPALELYRKSGRYWEVYPKTDWTYSQHSKDRVEIAPGVVAMPNMSRKTIHSLDESNSSLYSENVSHKNVSTETSYSIYGNSLSEGVKKQLFNNNQEDYYIRRRTETRWSTFKRTITSIFTSIFTVFYYTYSVQTTIFSYIHRAASKVMLWDTWLLWKTKPVNKAKRLTLLCLIPLLIFSGLWLLSTLGGAIYGTVSNYTNSESSLIPNLNFWDSSSDDNIQIERYKRDISISDTGFDKESNRFESNRVVEEKIVKIIERVHLEPPSANEIAASFSKEQLEAIAFAIKSSFDLNSQANTDDIVEKIVNNPSFHSIINNYYSENTKNSIEGSGTSDLNAQVLNNHQVLIDSLLKELKHLKEDLLLAERLRKNDYAHLSLDIKRCCNKKPVINVEGYVAKIMSDLLNDPEFLRKQKGLNVWLNSLFIAKKDLEHHLGNVTEHMDEKMSGLVEENGKIIMDKVASKLLEANRQHYDLHYSKREVTIEQSLSDEQIKRIVKSALAVYDADKTGLVDYAMETMGGQIVTTRCTETYHYGKAVVSVLGIPLWYPVNSPRTVITPSIAPGECWAFQNFPGFIVIKLSNKVNLEAVSIEHISRLLVPEGKIDSAPKEFEVYGLRSENDREPVKLGSYEYDYDGDALQFFLVDQVGQVFDMIEVRIVSNHGNPNYTCLYRFRVHGKLHHEPAR